MDMNTDALLLQLSDSDDGDSDSELKVRTVVFYVAVYVWGLTFIQQCL